MLVGQQTYAPTKGDDVDLKRQPEETVQWPRDQWGMPDHRSDPQPRFFMDHFLNCEFSYFPSYWRVGLLTLHRYPCQNFESHPKLKTTYGPYIHSLYRLRACFINEGCVRSSFSPSFWTAIDCSVLGYRTPSFPPATA